MGGIGAVLLIFAVPMRADAQRNIGITTITWSFRAMQWFRDIASLRVM